MPPLSSVVRTVRLGLTSVEIGFKTLFIVNCIVVPALIPVGPIIWVRVRVYVLESKEQGVCVTSVEVSMHFKFLKSVMNDYLIFSFSTLNHHGN
jgi:hypothetical protein